MEFSYCKLEIFVPESHLEQIRAALRSVDAGHIGTMTAACPTTRSPAAGGPWRAPTPWLGQAGELCTAPELKVEVTCRAEQAEAAIAAVKARPPLRGAGDQRHPPVADGAVASPPPSP